ncbi:MAG TPA: PRC and DUF2382 domain-containing protein [Acidimicrobiia bacterium]|nr:PRC and DUF2382 domain-containing protein [Acidimicrobiia bacterium]
MPTNASTIPMDRISSWPGRAVLAQDGHKIGKVKDIYTDVDTGRPEWLTVSTGWFNGRTSFVPLEQATERGGDVMVPFDEATVKEAPTADSEGRLSVQEEQALYRHYGRSFAPTGTARSDRSDGGSAMTRSEEELHVGTTTREAGRARLRKWVETEHVTRTVPVTREEIHVEREPITEGNVDRAMSGPTFREDVHEEVLREEDVVAEKRAVPKERVRLAKETVTEERRVDADLRKERIDMERSPGTDRRRR